MQNHAVGCVYWKMHYQEPQIKLPAPERKCKKLRFKRFHLLRLNSMKQPLKLSAAKLTENTNMGCCFFYTLLQHWNELWMSPQLYEWRKNAASAPAFWTQVNPRWETCVFYYYYSTLLARKTYRENENSNRASKLNCKNVSLSSFFFSCSFSRSR